MRKNEQTIVQEKFKNEVRMKLTKKGEKGITLIALVVTIIILLILAGVTLNIALSQNGLFSRAQNAADRTRDEVAKEDRYFGNLVEEMDSIYNVEGTNDDPVNKEPISKETSYVSYYAKINGEYGIIYADLAYGAQGNGKWFNTSYTIEKEENLEILKDYYIVEENYQAEGFGKGPVLAAINPDDESKKDRFYVMALEDFDEQDYCWYSGGFGEIIGSEQGFGKGYENTKRLIESWNEESYGDEDADEGGHKDIWGVVNEKFEKSWFVPSRDEWIAFAGELNINSDNYQERNLSSSYWSSSGSNAIQSLSNVHCMKFETNKIELEVCNGINSLRLSTTI